jgi:RNA polymerase sigma-70 factor (ECF subfamily)
MTSLNIVEFLLAVHRATLLAFAERRLGSRASAEDAVQQVSLRALERAEQLRDPEAGRAWLFQITRRLVVDQLRTPPVMDVIEGELSSSPPDDAEFRCSCVLANLRQLSDADARILRRSIVEGAPAAVLATELGLSGASSRPETRTPMGRG